MFIAHPLDQRDQLEPAGELHRLQHWSGQRAVDLGRVVALDLKLEPGRFCAHGRSVRAGEKSCPREISVFCPEAQRDTGELTVLHTADGGHANQGLDRR